MIRQVPAGSLQDRIHVPGAVEASSRVVRGPRLRERKCRRFALREFGPEARLVHSATHAALPANLFDLERDRIGGVEQRLRRAWPEVRHGRDRFDRVFFAV